MYRRLCTSLCGSLALAFAANVWGQPAYPARAVRVVVPYAIGGGADTISRILFTKLSEDFGQQFVIDNRGGSGTIGVGLVAKASPDGYVILHDATGFSINTGLNVVIGVPAVAERFASLSVQTRVNTPAEFGAFGASEIKKWGKVVRTANIKAE
jgi:tripartite-type tricarboxylate transporter receptor subunit TctC